MSDIGVMHQPFSANYAIGQLGVGETFEVRQAIETMRQSLLEFEGQIITPTLGQTIQRRILALLLISDELAGPHAIKTGLGS